MNGPGVIALSVNGISQLVLRVRHQQNGQQRSWKPGLLYPSRWPALAGQTVTETKANLLMIYIIYIYIYIKKNWRAAGLELTTRAPSRTIVTDGNC